MCGFFGQFTPLDSKLTHEESLQLTEHLTDFSNRRGPDDKKTWANPNRCYLGFRRLAILDLTRAGSQPMKSIDENSVLVFNGELYNYKNLRHELIGKGYSFSSTGDSEVVLQSLIEWGEKALTKFNGMFALAFYQKKERTILLARDPMGIKPLYYYHNSHGIIFSSEFQSLVNHPWANELSISKKGLALYLRLGFIPSPSSLLEGISMLEPGSYIKINAQNMAHKNYFYNYPIPNPVLNGNEAEEAVDHMVALAVKRQTISDVPIGSFLSGGIDSPLVTAKMLQIPDLKFSSYTIGSTDPIQNESEEASKYAELLKCKNKNKLFSDSDVIDYFHEAIAACGEPLADDSIFPTLMVSKLASKDVKVVLSGDGGDELFWGYSERFGSILEKCRDFKQPIWKRNLRWAFKKHFNLGRACWNLRFENIGKWYKSKHSYINEEKQNQIFPNLQLEDPSDKYFDFKGYEPEETAQWIRKNEIECHLQRVLLKVDRASMYHSVEVRVPLLDLELVELSSKINWKSCLNLKTKLGKIPLRNSLRRHITYQTHEKKGFGIPMRQWLLGPLMPLVHEHLLNKKAILGYPINQRALAKVWAEHQEPNKDYSRIIWSLLNLSLWENHYFKN